MEGMRKVGKQEVGQNEGGEMRNSREIGEELGKRQKKQKGNWEGERKKGRDGGMRCVGERGKR